MIAIQVDTFQSAPGREAGRCGLGAGFMQTAKRVSIRARP